MRTQLKHQLAQLSRLSKVCELPTSAENIPKSKRCLHLLRLGVAVLEAVPESKESTDGKSITYRSMIAEAMIASISL